MIAIDRSSGEEAILTPIAELRFCWVGDHWKHQIRSIGDADVFPLIWSIEGGRDLADHSRVVSPTYRRIDLRAEPYGARATLSGESGPHRFSATFDASETEDGVVIEVDVTDLCDRPVGALAATYSLEDAPGHARFDGGRLLWDRATHHLILAGDPPSTISAATSGIRSQKVEALGSIDPDRHVHRLRYRWRWSNEPDRILPWRRA